MDRRSRSPDSPISRRYRRRRRSRSYSRSRSRDRSRDRRRRYSRSSSQEHGGRRTGAGSNADIDSDFNQKDRDNRSHRQYGRRGDNRDNDRHYHRNRGYSSDSSDDSYSSQNIHNYQHYRSQAVSNKIIILGLPKHLTETDISNEMINYGDQPISIRLIRKRKSGSSRGFAFVEFNTEEEASRWMEYKQGVIVIQNQYRAIMQYSFTKGKIATDWYCVKCGVFNFKRRDNCFKCNASRDECEKGGEGSDEISSILTKKIMLRNLDVLTNEEGVLTNMQLVVPNLVSKISKVLICRDPLTSTSRGICYLSFENLIDSMNLHNALKALDPPLVIDDREILITYCVDAENRQLAHSGNGNGSGGGRQHKFGHDSNYGGKLASGHQYTLTDVPRLAEYSAGVYAQNPAEHEYYYKYYTDYYVEQINNGQFSNLPTMSQMGDTANSGAAVALSAMQRKQQKQPQIKTTPAFAAPPIQVPNGDGTKKYPTPDPSQYQYDASSGFYYDATTGLYYDANSQYYYNSDITSYLYWDQESSTYLLATQSQTESTSTTVTDATPTISTTPPTIIPNEAQAPEPPKPKEEKHDKVKVAKKIVKDMEKWAKQLNQKKDQSGYYAVPAPTPPAKLIVDDVLPVHQQKQTPLQPLSSGYADVGFAILENRENRTKKQIVAHFGSDSDTEASEQRPNKLEQDLVNFEQLTCLLCKRAFQSLDILNKHLKLSNLHKENLQKYTATGEASMTAKESDKNNGSDNATNSLYRDRAKERRQKYVEGDPPPVNKTRERFEKELKKNSSQLQKKASEQLATLPIGETNLGNRMLQKMGWTEGQGLGRANQGRTNIIEAEKRAPTAGLGTAATTFEPGDDYRTHIKRMMKRRYERAD